MNKINIANPFFTYGLFRHGQIAYLRIKQFVKNIKRNVAINGELKLRDGVPIYIKNNQGSIFGDIVYFDAIEQGNAYNAIKELETESQYFWDTIDINDEQVNILVGRKPNKGSDIIEHEWNGWEDPFFTTAMEVVKETLEKNREFKWDLKPIFYLQMAYMLLWSSIERYASLRYYLGSNTNVLKKVLEIAKDKNFVEALYTYAKDEREIYRADIPGDKEILNPNYPEKSLEYYYQVRCNITHRGKAVIRDYDTVLNSLEELFLIFSTILDKAKIEANT